ncbi:MAG: PCYCGC motif-containing (lipo)protein [Gemmatimonadota bacterium]
MAKLNQVGKWGSRPGRYRSALTTALLALAACGGGAEPASTGGGAEPPSTGAGAATRSGDPWITIEGVQFPAAFAEVPDEIVEAYVFAARHPEVLSYMPCYCGCERETPPHASNYDCFVDAIDRTGPLPRVDPDPMGFG